MTMHSIQVDDEVMAYLKKQAEPFVDTPNDVLRRVLSINARRQDSGMIVPPVPSGTPKALAQLLQVAHLVTQKGIPRPEATKLVAKFHGVAQQTVNDKYGRQAGLDAAGFDRLLAEPSLDSLRAHLLARFPRHTQAIRELLPTTQSSRS